MTQNYVPLLQTFWFSPDGPNCINVEIRLQIHAVFGPILIRFARESEKAV